MIRTTKQSPVSRLSMAFGLPLRLRQSTSMAVMPRAWMSSLAKYSKAWASISYNDKDIQVPLREC